MAKDIVKILTSLFLKTFLKNTSFMKSCNVEVSIIIIIIIITTTTTTTTTITITITIIICQLWYFLTVFVCCMLLVSHAGSPSMRYW